MVGDRCAMFGSMKWEKLDFCFNSSDYLEGFDGAAVPQAIPLDNDIIRVYYSPRDEHNRSHIFYVDINMNDLSVERFDI